jgi:hypothetical protein
MSNSSVTKSDLQAARAEITSATKSQIEHALKSTTDQLKHDTTKLVKDTVAPVSNRLSDLAKDVSNVIAEQKKAAERAGQDKSIDRDIFLWKRCPDHR